jgi:hypothetical protein
MSTRVSLIHALRHASPATRSIAATVLITFSWLVLQPAALAAKVVYAQYQQNAARTLSDDAKLSKALLQVQRTLNRAEEKLNAGQSIDTEVEALKDLRDDLDDLNETALAGFAETETYIKARKLPDLILQRHKDTVAAYRKDMSALRNNLRSIATAKDAEALSAAIGKAEAHMADKRQERSHDPVDPDNLPFGTPSADVRKPKRTKVELQELLKVQPIRPVVRPTPW